MMSQGTFICFSVVSEVEQLSTSKRPFLYIFGALSLHVFAHFSFRSLVTPTLKC